MSNSTLRGAQSIHGGNPQASPLVSQKAVLTLAQFLIEKVIRSRIYDSMYWKEHCFALTGTCRPHLCACPFAVEKQTNET
jgi:pre-mRNA-splicing factor 38A